tara:strand:+ start:1590 stop:1967 length:378 start_codon:yes stop_codon:yes gene_type:complete
MTPYNIYDEVEKQQDQSDLNRTRAPFFNENTWNPNIVDMFVKVLANTVRSKYPNAKITKEIFQKDSHDRDYMVKINIQMGTFNKNVDLAVEMIRSPLCPKNMPNEVANQFIGLIDIHLTKQKRKK